MASRIEIPILLLVVGLLFLAGEFVYPGLVSSPIGLVAFAIFIALYLYGAYWSLTIRRGFSGWIYRNQALGISLICFAFIVELLGNLLTLRLLPNNSGLSELSFLLRFYVLLMFTFYWIDNSMRTIHDIDPLSRDTLHWSKLRYVAWALSLACIGIISVYIAITAAITGNYQFLVTSTPGILPAIIMFLVPIPIYVYTACGVIALPIGALRSKDKNLQKQIAWFALANLFFFVLGVLATMLVSSSFLQNAIQAAGFPVGGYCLYRSARALVPLNQRSLEADQKPEIR